ncbi:hypothetical protein Mal65_27740 [Crateriforma conspicua]|nr:hypothetical protein Mal65_27740 [Crateriforma conspicua]
MFQSELSSFRRRLIVARQSGDLYFASPLDRKTFAERKATLGTPVANKGDALIRGTGVNSAVGERGRGGRFLRDAKGGDSCGAKKTRPAGLGGRVE